MSAFFLRHPRETDLALFAGGELGPLSRWRIERHIESCERCERIAADFFRLPDQISELGELPEVDWNAMAEGISGRLRAEAATETPASERKYGSAIWQLGAAAACLIAVIAVTRQPPTYGPAEPVASQAERKEEAQAPARPAPARQEGAASFDESREAEPQAEQFTKAKPASVREQVRSAASEALNSPRELIERDAAQLRDSRMDEKLTSDIAAPPPPASPGERAEPTAKITAKAQPKFASAQALERLNEERVAGGAGTGRLRSDLGLARRSVAEAESAPMPAAVLSLSDKAEGAAPALRIQPPAGVRFEAVPGADGKITLRYFDPETGVLTIVDVDAP